MEEQRLTDRSELSSLAVGDKIHIVDVSDSTDNAAGSSKWFLISTISSYLAALTQTLTNKTLTSPKINEDVAVTVTATELNYVDGVTSAVQTQLDAKVADTGDETIAGVKTFSSSPIVPTPTTNFQAATKAYVDSLVTGGDGWTVTSDTWVYGSATTFTIAGVDRTATFTTGTRIKLTQTTAKYFVVVSSSFSTNTTVTVTGGSDYTVANAAITSPYYSYQVNPQGYPDWFNFTGAFSGAGFSSNPTISTSRFRVVGRMCQMLHTESASGGSDNANFAIVLPITSRSVSGAVWSAPAQVLDNGTTQTNSGLMHISSASAIVTIYKNWLGDGFTASGNKRLQFGQIEYEI